MKNLTKVYLVGSGPSGVELLTLRAADLLRSADIIVYDALVDPRIYKLFNKAARRVYVGKRSGKHSLTQEQINELLVDLALEHGGQIVRLKGGDPFVFGRGGEEMMALRSEHIPYEVVPGITAGIAAPAYSGIPVTHRQTSRSVSLITGATADGSLPPLDWEAYVRLGGTLVFYMSMRAVPEIAHQLLSHGMRSDMPCAIISHGTRPAQRTITTTLQALTPTAYDYEAFAPGLLVVGDVTAMAHEYSWYECPKLSGQRILVTRSLEQASTLEAKLINLGAETTLLPTIELEALPLHTGIGEAIEHLGEVACLAFTSPSAVEYWMQALQTSGRDARTMAGICLATIGTATAEALARYGLTADLVSPLHTAQGMAEAILADSDLPQSGLILNPTSTLSGGDLTRHLNDAGRRARTLSLYHNKPKRYTTDELHEYLSPCQWVTLCSASAVDGLMALVREHGAEHLLSEVRFACIGPITARRLKEYGYTAHVCPNNPSIDALVAELVAHV